MSTVNLMTHMNLWVHDQDEALAFYTEKIGLEVREDVTFPELGNYRWLTMGAPGQPNFAVVLNRPAAPIVDGEDLVHMQSLMAKGLLGGLFFATDDCRATHKELAERGVEFVQEPSERPYGIDAGFRDPSGNHSRLVQTRLP
jgi:predicted enzyme related to lactoylglutathione lyase